MRKQLDTYDGKNVCVGDIVYVRATVAKIVRPEEILVGFRSATTEYEELVRADLCELDLPELPDEPADGTMLTCRSAEEVNYIFKRDDAEGHNDRGARRHNRHWWSYVDQTWVDWQYVVAHGGRDAQVLVVAAAGPELLTPDPLAGLGISDRDTRAIVDVLKGCIYKGRTTGTIAKMVQRRVSAETVGLLTGRSTTGGLTSERVAALMADSGKLEEHLRWRAGRGDMKLTGGSGTLQDRWTWIKPND